MGVGKKQRGFTLVELLIVMVVVAVLGGLVFTAHANTQKRARDARRADDINSLRSLILSYEAVNETLPNPQEYNESNSAGYDTSASGDWLPFLRDVMNGEIPKDPLNNETGHPVDGGKFTYFYTCYRHGQDVEASDPDDDVMRLGYRQETTGEVRTFDVNVAACH